MRRLPIDTSTISFTVAQEPRPVTDFETGQRKVSDNGEPLFSLQLLATSPEEITIISVKTPSVAEGLHVNDPVQVRRLAAVAWTNNGRAALAFSAERIEAAANRPKAAA